jgi:polyphosphate kinase 2 (PPK2 family)
MVFRLHHIKSARKDSRLLAQHLEDINMFERQLTDDGYHIIKFLFRISKKEQKKRLKKLMASKDTYGA